MGGILQVDTIQNNNTSTLITQTNATTITISRNGQTVSIPSGATLQTDTIQNTNSSALITQTNATTITIGTSGQTITIPSGVTFNTTSATVNLPSSIITGQTAETSVAGGDLVLIYDDSATALRKMTRTNFVAGVGGTNTPLISASHTSSVSIPNNTTTRLPLNGATFDTAGWYDSTNTRITVPSGTPSGKVLIVWQTTQSNNAGNNCGGFLFKNASVIQEDLMFYTGNNSEILTSGGGFITNYAAGDYFNIYAFTDGSGTFSSTAGTAYSFIHMFKLIE